MITDAHSHSHTMHIHILKLEMGQLTPLKVKVTDGIPAVVTPLKPKYYFTGVTSVAAKSAVKLQ